MFQGIYVLSAGQAMALAIAYQLPKYNVILVLVGRLWRQLGAEPTILQRLVYIQKYF